jgi:hypothetical protein
MGGCSPLTAGIKGLAGVGRWLVIFSESTNSHKRPKRPRNLALSLGFRGILDATLYSNLRNSNDTNTDGLFGKHGGKRN